MENWTMSDAIRDCVDEMAERFGITKRAAKAQVLRYLISNVGRADMADYIEAMLDDAN
jgi:hypothetical protein